MTGIDHWIRPSRIESVPVAPPLIVRLPLENTTPPRLQLVNVICVVPTAAYAALPPDGQDTGDVRAGVLDRSTAEADSVGVPSMIEAPGPVTNRVNNLAMGRAAAFISCASSAWLSMVPRSGPVDVLPAQLAVVVTIAATNVMADQDIQARDLFESFMAFSSPVPRVMSNCIQSRWLDKKQRARVFASSSHGR